MNSVRLYVLSIIAGAALATTLVVSTAPSINSTELQAVLWLGVLGLISLLQGYQLPTGGSASTAFIPLLACAVVSPSWATVLAVAMSDLIAELINRRALLKTSFNVAQKALAISSGIIAFSLLGGESLLTSGHVPLSRIPFSTGVAVLGLVFVAFVANSAAVSAAIALSNKQRFVEVWRQNSLGTVIYDLLCAPIVLLFAWVYVNGGALGSLAVFLPLLGVRQLYKTNRQLSRLNEELLQLMVKAIEARDPYTSGHSRRVAHYSRIIARAVGLSGRQIENVATAALLHDVGKIHEIFAPILRKPGRLTAEEWSIMQTHSIKSAELVGTVSHLRSLVLPVRHHHENWDGTGYPDGLAGYAIPLESRIIMFADTIDAMTSDRPYRAALGETEVRGELNRMKGRQFDPEICDKLLNSSLFALLFAPHETSEFETKAPKRSPVAAPQRVAMA